MLLFPKRRHRREGKPRVAFVATHPIQNQAPLYRALAELGTLDFEVIFASRWGTEASYDEEFKTSFKWDVNLLAGYPHRFAKSVNWVNKFFPSQDPRKAWSRISDELADFDFVVIRGYSAVAERQALAHCLMTDTPFAMMPEGYELGQPQQKSILSWVRSTILTFIYAKARIYISIGTRSTEHFLKFCNNWAKVVVAHYCVDNSFFRRPPEYQWTKSLETTQSIVRFLYAGKFSQRKGVLTLVEAFKRAFGADDDVMLTFVGDGELRGQLQELCSDRQHQLKINHFRNQTEMRKVYWDHDCLVLPSAWGETWGLVVNEAMAAGLPAIVSDICGCAADTITEKTGLVFRGGDAEDLAAAIQKIAARFQSGTFPDLAGLKDVSEKIGPDAAAKAISSALMKIL